MKLAGVDSALSNPPIELAPVYQDVRDEMLRQIDQRFGAAGSRAPGSGH
jgi:hypothetical protein